MSDSLPEPWLRGPIAGLHPALMPVFHSFAQVREDLAKHTAGLTDEQVWRKPKDAPSLGFQLRHITGSVDRLVTYLMGGQVSQEQLNFLRKESEQGATLSELLDGVDASLRAAEAKIRTIPMESLFESRAVGRKLLPTTVIGLLVHTAEHTQRHLGQAITTAKWVRSEGELLPGK